MEIGIFPGNLAVHFTIDHDFYRLIAVGTDRIYCNEN